MSRVWAGWGGLVALCMLAPSPAGAEDDWVVVTTGEPQDVVTQDEPPGSVDADRGEQVMLHLDRGTDEQDRSLRAGTAPVTQAPKEPIAPSSQLPTPRNERAAPTPDELPEFNEGRRERAKGAKAPNPGAPVPANALKSAETSTPH